jgi:predicted transcriptional regulator
MAMRPMAVNLPPELMAEVRKEAEKDHRSFGYIVREALVEWLARKRKGK